MKEIYEYATLQEVDEFFDGEVTEVECIDEGCGIGRSEITTWTDGKRTLRRVHDFGTFDWSEKYEWVSLRTP